MSSDIVLKALAISAVVFNHSHPDRPFNYAGGMTVLLMLSGYTFARFSLQAGAAKSTRRAIARFAFRIWLPCVFIVLLSFLVRREFNLLELLFISNLFSNEFLSFMFIWYPQVILQILAVIYLLFCFPAAANAFHHNPLQGSIVLFAAAMAVTIFWRPYADMGTSRPILPFPIAWNFLLGCVVFFALRPRATPGTEWGKPALIAATIASACSIYGLADIQFWTLSAAVTVMALRPNLGVPRVFARVIYVVGQATFAIFLLHAIFLRVYEHVLQLDDPDGAWVFAMVCSTLTWVAASAAMRAFVHKTRPVKVGIGERVEPAAAA